MAAPAAASRISFVFRDLKGQTAKMKFLVGGADAAGVQTNYLDLQSKLQACSNGHVSLPISSEPDRTRGGSGNYQSVEDKAQLVFTNPKGSIFRFQLPCPLTSDFLADEETVNPADTNVAALTNAIHSYVFGRDDDTAPLTFVGGIRQRRKFQRKFNIFTQNPTETGPGE